MTPFAPLLLTLVLGQTNTEKVELPTDEELVAGHPEGDSPALPKQVSWDLAKSIEKTPKRQRISLAGKWRFTAVPERDTRVLRDKMGWIDMPAGPPADWKTYDQKLSATGGKWSGKPLADYPWAWAERVIDAPIAWTQYQVFLVLQGPWSQAEVFAGYLPIEGKERNGARWFEITEDLTYEGSAAVTLRFKNPPEEPTGAAAAKPYVGLELTPTLPRFDGIALRRDNTRGELEIQVDLRRPKFFLGLQVRVSEMPLAVKLQLEDVETGQEVQVLEQSIGQMPKEQRSVTLRLAWSKKTNGPAPKLARLRATLTTTLGGTLDIPFPIEFKPAELEPVSP